MSSQRVMSVLLVLTWLAIDAALISHVLQNHAVWPHPVIVCGMGLAFGQVALACWWFVWSPRNLSIRVAGGLVGLYLCAHMAALFSDGLASASRWFALICVYSTLLAIPLAILKRAGYCWTAESAVPERATRLRRFRQFSVGGLLSLTTAVAFLLGARQFWEAPAKHPLTIATFCLLLAIAGLISLALSCRARPSIPWTLAAILLCPVWALCLSLTHLPPEPVSHLSLAMMLVIQGAATAASITVLRVAGYRLDGQVSAATPACP